MTARKEAIDALLAMLHQYQDEADLENREFICSTHHRNCKQTSYLAYWNALARSGLHYKRTATDSISVSQLTNIRFSVLRRYNGENLFVEELPLLEDLKAKIHTTANDDWETLWETVIPLPRPDFRKEDDRVCKKHHG